MRNNVFINKDTTIYEAYPTKPNGLDEVLEIGKTNNGTYAVRSLVYFPISDISASVVDGTYPATTQYELNLFVANAELLIPNQEIFAYPLSSSWEEGSGYYYQSRIYETYGATWKNRSSGSSWNASGSDYLTSYTGSVTMSNPVIDVKIDITEIVKAQLSGTIPNYGLLLAFSGSEETNSFNRGNVKVFSKDTHTIFKPYVSIKYDNTTYSTGSLTASTNFDAIRIQAENLQASYLQDEAVRVEIHVRPEFPTKTFADTLTTFDDRYYLPTSSYFSIFDVQSRTEIIPFDVYSKIQNDGSGSYIEFNTSVLYTNRKYQLRYKVNNGSTVRIYSDPRIFTIRDF